MKNVFINAIVAFGPDGKEQGVVELTDEEFNAL